MLEIRSKALDGATGKEGNPKLKFRSLQGKSNFHSTVGVGAAFQEESRRVERGLGQDCADEQIAES